MIRRRYGDIFRKRKVDRRRASLDGLPRLVAGTDVRCPLHEFSAEFVEFAGDLTASLASAAVPPRSYPAECPRAGVRFVAGHKPCAEDRFAGTARYTADGTRTYVARPSPRAPTADSTLGATDSRQYMLTERCGYGREIRMGGV